MSTARRAILPLGMAGALALAIPMIGEFEGKRNDPYKDIAGIPTVCYGETRVVMRRYSDKECNDMLEKAVREFAEPVAKLTPTIAENPAMLAAATSLAYNIGVGNYSNSSVRKLFLAKRFKEACNAFGAWNKARVKGVLTVSNGLVNRRKKETQLCLSGS